MSSASERGVRLCCRRDLGYRYRRISMLKGFHQAVSPFSPYVKLYIAAVALLLLVALQSPSSAQVLYGALTGNVVDPNGAAVAGAQIEARDANTGTVQQATTDGNGIYRFVTLLPGTYTVTVTAPGFAKQVTEKVGIAVNEVRRLNGTLILAMWS